MRFAIACLYTWTQFALPALGIILVGLPYAAWQSWRNPDDR